MSSIIENGMYVSLKREWYAVIESDIHLFRTNVKAKDNKYEFTINKFLNNVFLNMYDGRKPLDSAKRTRNIGAKSFNIKINNEIKEKLKKAGFGEDDFISDISAYYMQFIEEYCKLPLNEREKVFYKQTISELNDAIELKYNLKIEKNNLYNGYIFPYKIKQSDENNGLYITGFGLSKEYVYKGTICIPIRKICNIERVKKITPETQIKFSNYSKIQSYKDMQEYIENRFANDGILYLSDILRDVTVKLSDKGIENLYSRTQYRPRNISFDEQDEHIIHFKATLLQTFMYFFKFGSDAQILEPQKYREHFFNQYEKAFKLYSQNI